MSIILTNILFKYISPIFSINSIKAILFFIYPFLSPSTMDILLTSLFFRCKRELIFFSSLISFIKLIESNFEISGNKIIAYSPNILNYLN